MANALINLGAINKVTKKYELPKFANKANKYECPDCHQKVMLKKGQKRRAHFSHYKSTNAKTACKYYERVGESQIHKHAKIMMKYVLEHNKCSIKQTCSCCKEVKTFNIPKIEVDYEVDIEQPFVYKKCNKIADVSVSKGDNIKYIFEICYKHKTHEGDRPEPWFEIDAVDFIQYVENNDDEDVEIDCIRDMNCKLCKKFNELDLKDLEWLLENPKELEWYVRYKLGQRRFVLSTEEYRKMMLKKYENNGELQYYSQPNEKCFYESCSDGNLEWMYNCDMELNSGENKPKTVYEKGCKINECDIIRNIVCRFEEIQHVKKIDVQKYKGSFRVDVMNNHGVVVSGHFNGWNIDDYFDADIPVIVVMEILKTATEAESISS